MYYEPNCSSVMTTEMNFPQFISKASNFSVLLSEFQFWLKYVVPRNKHPQLINKKNMLLKVLMKILKKVFMRCFDIHFLNSCSQARNARIKKL